LPFDADADAADAFAAAASAALMLIFDTPLLLIADYADVIYFHYADMPPYADTLLIRYAMPLFTPRQPFFFDTRCHFATLYACRHYDTLLMMPRC